VISHYSLNIPWNISYTLAYTMSCIGPAILDLIMFKAVDEGYGQVTQIPQLLIAAAPIDDMISILLNGVCTEITFAQVLNKGDTNLGKVVGSEIAQIITGIAVGAAIGLIAWPLSFIFKNSRPKQLILKGIFCTAMCLAITIGHDLSGYTQGRFICALTAGIVMYRFWGEDGRPNHEMHSVTAVIQPLLFGYIGSQLMFNKIKPALIGYSFLIVCIPVMARGLCAFCVSSAGKYNLKNRIFIGICWLPKATVQATVSGLFLARAQKEKNALLIDYGEQIQTIGLMAIFICGPLGSILISSLYDKLLEPPVPIKEKKDTDEEKEIKEQNKVDDIVEAHVPLENKEEDVPEEQVAEKERENAHNKPQGPDGG